MRRSSNDLRGKYGGLLSKLYGASSTWLDGASGSPYYDPALVTSRVYLMNVLANSEEF